MFCKFSFLNSRNFTSRISYHTFESDAANDILEVNDDNDLIYGGDFIFTTGIGTLTVKDGKGKNISVTDSTGSQTFDLFENKI